MSDKGHSSAYIEKGKLLFRSHTNVRLRLSKKIDVIECRKYGASQLNTRMRLNHSLTRSDRYYVTFGVDAFTSNSDQNGGPGQVTVVPEAVLRNVACL